MTVYLGQVSAIVEFLDTYTYYSKPNVYTVLPTIIAPTSAYWRVIKTTTYCPNSFSCGFFETLGCGVLITDHFFHIYSALEQCAAFGRFFKVEKVLTLGSFPFTV